MRTINYNLPTMKTNTTFYGVKFTLPNHPTYILTNATIRLQAKKNQIGSPYYDLIINKTGELDFEIPKQLITLQHGIYQYDILIKYPSREVRYIAGTFEVEPTITIKI